MPRLTLPDFTPHAGQRRLIAAARPRNVACMGRRWGKTYALTEILLNQPGGALSGARGDGRNGLPCAWYAPNDSYFSKVFQGIVNQYAGIVRKATTQPRPVIEFANGGSVDFWTLENPMKCGRGNFYGRVIVDEAAHARHLKDAWEQTIEFTLADLDGDAWFISTPYGRNYFHELYRRAERDADWVSHTAPSTDNPYLPAGWMDEKRSTMPERVFAQEVLAQFLDSGAGVFRRIMEAVDPSLPTEPHRARAERDGSYLIGVDWGRHEDFTVLVVIDAVRRAVIAVDRFTQIDYAIQLGRLRALAERFPRAPVLAEANSMGGPLIEQLRRDGLPVQAFTTTAASKAQAIEALALAFERGEIRIPNVPALVDELLAFDQERLPSGAIRYGAPSGAHDDCVMALAIAWHGLGQQGGFYAARSPKAAWQP